MNKRNLIKVASSLKGGVILSKSVTTGELLFIPYADMENQNPYAVLISRLSSFNCVRASICSGIC